MEKSENSLFLLLAGVSGVGKTTVMNELKKLNDKYIYISPDITRPLRDGETDKNYISKEQLLEKKENGEYLIVNEINGIYYATPKKIIEDCFSDGNIPLLDFPIEKTEIISDFVNGQVFITYLAPPSLEELKRRLSLDGRDKNGLRYKSASKELEKYHNHEYDYKIDLHFLIENGTAYKIAETINNNIEDKINTNKEIKSIDTEISNRIIDETQRKLGD